MFENFAVDLISDLNLTDLDHFDWTGKSTSLFCVVAGNVSDDLTVLKTVLQHLGDNYRGVLFIDGSLEHKNLSDYESRVEQIKEICDGLQNVVYIHNHIVILNHVAFIGCNGWYGNRKTLDTAEDLDYLTKYRTDDIGYLSVTIKQLQDNPDCKRIVLVTNSIPSEYLGFKSPHVNVPQELNLSLCLLFDRGEKITKWLFGTTDIDVDVELNNRQYVNNPVKPGLLYWPKRIKL
jgi:hypothetical protein